MARTENRLARERSEYLRQHALNPIDWYPWGDEALARARQEGKPIFLSVGYSACHWCHVMEREVFAKEDVAELLNQHFISIKVDREERPDLDGAYMEALHALTGSGGWPMSLFLTPELKPFFGGTYIPHAGFLTIADRVRRAYRDQRSSVELHASLLAQELESSLRPSPAPQVDQETIDQAAERLLDETDRRWGGTRGPMKFPSPPRWLFLLHHYRRTGDARYADVVRTTLEAMATGGIQDQLSGGFHRYAVEETWLIPHFEKMLYDNAQLALLYLEASVTLDAPRFAAVARRTLDFIEREMTDTSGAFCSSLDADTDGEEGAVYLWSPEELVQVAGPEDGHALSLLLDVRPQERLGGRSVLSRRRSPSSVAEELGRDEAELSGLLGRWTPALLEARSGRRAPSLDHKVISSWNGLAIAAFARAHAVLGEERYRRAAERAADYLWQVHRLEDGALCRSSNGGLTGPAGVLSDYMTLGIGFLELFQATMDPAQLRRAMSLASELKRFVDRDGGLFLTAEGQEAPLGRQRDVSDSVRPSGTAQAIRLLTRLGALTGDEELTRAAQRALRGVDALLRRLPSLCPASLDAAQDLVAPVRLVVVSGRPDDERTQELLRTYWQAAAPNAQLLHVPEDGPSTDLAELLPTARGKIAQSGRPTARVCEAGRCQEPTSDPATLRRQILEGLRG